MARGCLSSGSSKRGVVVVGGCILSVFAVCVLVVCLCFGGSMMGTLYAMSVAALIVVGALLLLLLDQLLILLLLPPLLTSPSCCVGQSIKKKTS